MNKSELIDAIAEKTEMSKKSANANLDALIEVMTKELSKKGKISLVGFGTFETRKRAARKGRNPQTGEEMKIPASTVPAFKAGKGLKDAVNK